MPINSSQSTWRLFIEARKKLTALYEQPLITKGVVQQSNPAGFTLELDQTFTQDYFYKSLKQKLDISEDQIDRRSGCFYLDWHTQTTSIQLEQFADIAAACYFDYDPNPFLSGTLSISRNMDMDALLSDAQKHQLILKFDERQGRIQFPPKDYLKLQALLSSTKWQNIFSLPDTFQIVLSIAPDYPRYLDRLLHESGLAGNISIRNKQISEKDQLLKLKFKANVPISDDVFEYFENKGFVRGIEGECHKFKSQLEVSEYKALFYRNHTGLKQILSEFSEIKLKTGSNKDYLIFNETDIVIFEKVLSKLTAIRDIRLFYKPEYTIASILARSGNALLSLAEKLKVKFPAIEIESENFGRRLRFMFFIDFNERFSKRLDFINSLDQELNGVPVVMNLNESQRLAFVAHENSSLKAFQEAERLSRLTGEEFCIGTGPDMPAIGTLRKVHFPYLVFQRALSDEELKKLDLQKIHANLRGEREKIERLNQTMDKLSGDGKSLPNSLTKSFVFDSSKARPIADPDQLLIDGPLWQEIEAHSYQPLNPSQTRAVLSTLLSPDLALVQGPPGTGKSTAISQIIWHLIRTNPRQQVLLTSETNMAVDNAIEKLEHPVHNLVKPVRIGKETNLESEGSRYALSRFAEWVKSDKDSVVNDNAIARWLHKIAKRAEALGELPENLQSRWKIALSNPPHDLRKEATDIYMQHSNVVASTGSYIGETNSEGKKTGFFRQYLQLLRLRKTNTEQLSKGKKTNQYKIAFDVVVMDEASKATPPELALPLTYAKKAIVIGDHRQLPPLLDEEEFATTLNGAGGAELARAFISNKEGLVSQFERLFLNSQLDPSLVSRFNRQYRMHPHINEVIKQFYTEDGGLECGIPDADADDPNLTNPLSRYHGMNHDGFIAPGTHLLWINVDEPEIRDGSSRINLSEVEAVRRVIQYLKNSDGFKQFQEFWKKPEEQEIGLISFYGKQLFYLDQVRQEFADTVPLRVRTVDRFQGMERNIIIVSMVRSNKIISSPHQSQDFKAYPENGGYPKQTSLGFAELPNRLNVALSRAKRLLVIVGNSDHFCRHECYKRVFDRVKELGAVIDYKTLTRY